MDKNVHKYEYAFIEKDGVILRGREVSICSGDKFSSGLACLLSSEKTELIGEAFNDSIPDSLRLKSNIFLVIK
jgi:hypothetical protein